MKSLIITTNNATPAQPTVPDLGILESFGMANLGQRAIAIGSLAMVEVDDGSIVITLVNREKVNLSNDEWQKLEAYLKELRYQAMKK